MGTPQRRLALTWLWLGSAFLLLAFPLRFWSQPVGRAMLAPAACPADHSNPELAAQWRFLRRVAPLVPPGASFTVRERPGGPEMEAFMLAVGLIPHGRPLPSSYYGRQLPEVGGQADLVLALPGAEGSEAGLELVARVEGGALFRRRAGP